MEVLKTFIKMILNKNNLQITQILILNKITYITFMINITIYKNILYNRYKFPSYKIRYIKINMTDNVINNDKNNKFGYQK